MSDDKEINVILAAVKHQRSIASRNKRNRYMPSKLEPQRAFIRRMAAAGSSYGEIAFAVSCGAEGKAIPCGRTTVYDFIKKMDD